MSTEEIDPRVRAGATDFELGDEEDQNLTDFGNDLDPNAPQDPPADPPAQDPPAQDPPADAPSGEDPPADPPSGEDPPADPDPNAKPRNPMIPRARFDEVNEKLKATRARVAELEAKQAAAPAAPTSDTPPPPTFDFDGKEAEYMEAVLDGDKDKALALRKEIRAAEVKQLQPAAKEAPLDVETVKAALKFDEAVAELNAKYPVFDPKADDFDKELTAEAVVLSRTYQGRGMAPHEALRKAVGVVAKAHDLTEAGAQPDPEPKKDDPPAPPVKKDPPAPTPDQTKAKLDVAKTQPPKPAGKSLQEPTLDVDQMSEEEFAALPEATLRRLRGDTL